MAEGVIDGMVSSTVTTGESAPSFGEIIVGAISSGLMYFLKALVSIPALLFGIMLVLTDFVVTLFIDLIANLIQMSDLQQMINQLPSSDFMSFMFYLMAFDYGFPLILSASIVKFLIRRIPFVG